MKRAIGQLSIFLSVILWVELSSPGAVQPGSAEIVRDTYGVPHIFASTLEDAAFAIGYAQAEDRLEELLRNYRKAEGTMSEAFGAEWYRHDYRQRLWRHAEVSRERYDTISPTMRRAIEAYQEGIKRYMKEHPAKVPAWAPELHPAQVISLGRYIIWGWPEGEAGADLRRAGITPDPVQYRGSNQMLLASSRSALKAPIAVIDPHLGWYGEFRFYEVRIYAGSFKVSGVSILGIPFPSLGHSQWASVAMTTGGPDTSDVYEEEIHPDNPRLYRFEGQWREMQVRETTIQVKKGDQVVPSKVEIESTHHGPIVARQGKKAYTMAIPYRDEVGLSDQVYRMFTARNLTEMKQGLAMLQLMSQNIMVGTVQGDIYYLRNGRVPIRPKGCDSTRPLPGTGGCEWQGVHPIQDLIQVTNPPQGYMQNNNVSPFAMMKESPMRAEQYADRPWLYNDENRPAHQRGAMTLEQLHAAQGVTVEQAIDLAYSPEIHQAAQWQARLRSLGTAGPASSASGSAGSGLSAAANQVYRQILDWNRRSDADSVGALSFFAFKASLETPDLRRAVEVPTELTDAQISTALSGAAQWLTENVGSIEAPYGRYFRVGREGGKTYPVAGGTLQEYGMATPRAITFAKRGKEMVGQGGQTSTQVVVLTKVPQSWTIIPLGMSDHRDSPHWDDQAEKLFSQSRMKSSYFLRRAELLKNSTQRKRVTR
jgi:acyl-homoserine lactone acylase PvdQ